MYSADNPLLSEKTGIRQRVLNEIVHLAQMNNVDNVILFGSRARGDYKRTSDIDIAFFGGNTERFILGVDEETHTLLKFDIVALDKPVDAALRKSIFREGITLYAKS